MVSFRIRPNILNLFCVFLFIAQAMSQAMALPKPFSPEDLLTPDEIEDIQKRKNFFLNRKEPGAPVWQKWDRKFVDKLLSTRNHKVSFKEIIDTGFAESFNLRFSMEDLYRAKMARLSAIGGVTPQLDITLGKGLTHLLVENAFSNIFSFFLPQNWLFIEAKHKAYEAAKLSIIQVAMDQSVSMKITYFNTLQIIQDTEILAFYFAHTQMLARFFKEKSPELADSFQGFADSLGVQLAVPFNQIGPSLNNVLLSIAKTIDDGRYAADHFNISNPPEILTKVDDYADLPEIGEIYKDRNEFTKEVVNRSVEIKIAKYLYEISKINVGIAAFAPSFVNKKSPSGSADTPVFQLTLGFSTIPNINIAIANKRTAKIALNQVYITILDKARRSHGNYNIAIREYVEATRSLEQNKKAFYQNLHNMLVSDNPKALITLTLQTMSFLVNAEIYLNQALHNAWRYRLVMDRYLLAEEKTLSADLYARPEVQKALEFFKKEFPFMSAFDTHVDNIVRTVKTSKDLKMFLAGDILDENETKRKLDPTEVAGAITRNLVYVLDGKFLKSQDFYEVLKKYVEAQNILISRNEKTLLKTYASQSRFSRLFTNPSHHEEPEDAQEILKAKEAAKKDLVMPKNRVKRGRYLLNGRDYFSLARKA